MAGEAGAIEAGALESEAGHTPTCRTCGRTARSMRRHARRCDTGCTAGGSGPARHWQLNSHTGKQAEQPMSLQGRLLMSCQVQRGRSREGMTR